MPGRRQAREAVLQLLYQHDANPDISQETARDMLDELIEPRVLREFGWRLYVETCARQTELDRQIQEVAHNWRLSRMGMTDRNVLRLGVCEMLALGTPGPVVLDECIELARQFGNAQSSQFVNGILDKLIPKAKDIDGVDPSEPEAITETPAPEEELPASVE